jgi:pyrroloquinoline quinone biosynthesis protein B
MRHLACAVLALLPLGARVASPSLERAVVLGVAQDGGVPHIGCDQELCRRALRDPAARHRVTSLGLVDDASGSRWLIDATPDIRTQLDTLHGGRAFDRRKPVDGILLTHAHAGHYAGLLELGREMLGTDAVPVYGTPRMVAFLRGSSPWRELEAWGHVRYLAIEPGRELVLGPFRVTPLLVPHRDELSDTVGYRVRGASRSLLFVPDVDKWQKWDRDLASEVAAVDVALLDATFFADGEIPGRRLEDIPHPFVPETLARLAEPALRERVAFIHLNHTNRLLWDAAARDTLRGARVAADGEVIPLGTR